MSAHVGDAHALPVGTVAGGDARGGAIGPHADTDRPRPGKSLRGSERACGADAAMHPVAPREHERLEEQLRELMVQDKTARAKHDKLVAELQAVGDEIARIAAEKVKLTGQLTGLYKKHANGQGKR